MCGREGPTSKAIVEGSMMEVCSRCARFGNVIEVKPLPVEVREQPRAKPFVKVPVRKEPEPIIIILPDYASKVKSAREKALLTQEELARAIAEKESVIQKVESSQFEPPISLARKLELFLKIDIIRELKADEVEKPKKFDLKDSALTIGDLVRLRKSK